MRLGALVALLLFVSPAVAGKGGRRNKDLPAPAAVFEGQAHMQPFLDALRATDYGLADHPVRISFVGDSITADDHIVERLRELLGARFGHGGPGFVHPVALKMSANHGVKRWNGKGWRAFGVANPPPPDRMLGFGGAYAETKSGGTVTFKPIDRATSADLYWLGQPGGGDLDVIVDGKRTRIETKADAKRGGFTRIEADQPIRTLTVKARGRTRLFGVDLEGDRGVVVDNLGVKNATAKAWNKIRRDHWEAQIAHRAPDLMVVLIGTNEAGWLGGKSLHDYRAIMDTMLAPVQGAHAPCLVISALDQVDFRLAKLPQRRSIEPIVAAQRAAAEAAGCAFWDAYQWMGGPRASLTWLRRHWMSNDFAHPTAAGSRRIADALARGVLDAYYASR